MEFRYNGEHSILIYPYGDLLKSENDPYDTWIDFSLIPSSRPFTAPNKPEIDIIQIPARNNFIDYTDKQISMVSYGECSGEWEFIIDHNHLLPELSIYLIESFINGRLSIVQLKDEVPDNIRYKGRVYISNISAEEDYTKVTLSYILKPLE